MSTKAPVGYNFVATVKVCATCKETGKPIERTITVDYYAGNREPDNASVVKKILRKAATA